MVRSEPVPTINCSDSPGESSRQLLLKSSDYLVVFAAVACSLLFGLIVTPWHATPLEDAAIMMRYAQQLAAGHGIVWNIGEHPVDGATDFLFLIATAAMTRAGLHVETAIRLLAIFAHLAAVGAVCVTALKAGTTRLTAWVGATALGCGAAWFYIGEYFGTAFFAFWAALAWMFASTIIRLSSEGRGSQFANWLFALSCFLLALTRPEGCLITLILLLAVLRRNEWRRPLRLVAPFLIVFLLLGGPYFLWHWHYFGYPLPNPYYVKGHSVLHPESLFPDLKYMLLLTFGFIWVWPFAYRSKSALRDAALGLTIFVPYTAIWLLLSNEKNYHGRFQYAITPIAAVLWCSIVDKVAATLTPGKRRAWYGGAYLVAFLAAMTPFLRSNSIGLQFGQYEVALQLRALGTNHTMVASESGLLPAYSGWKSIDPWGLNDRWIAHHGLTPDYLDQYHPDLVMFHASEIDSRTNRWGRKWGVMTEVLHQYVRSHGYLLAGSYGPSCGDKHFYYVRKDSPIAAQLTKAVGEEGQYWWGLPKGSAPALNLTAADQKKDSDAAMPLCGDQPPN